MEGDEKKFTSTTIPVIIHEPSSPDGRMFASRIIKLQRNSTETSTRDLEERLQAMGSNSEKESKGFVLY